MNKKQKCDKRYVVYKKKKSYFGNKLFSKRDLVYAAICLIVLVIVLAIKAIASRSIEPSDLFDIKTFSAVIAVFILNALTNGVVNLLQLKHEDDEKLISDYDTLLKMYKNVVPVKYTNAPNACYKVGRKHTRCSHEETADNEDTYKIPLADVVSFVDKDIKIIDNPEKFYKLPEKIDGAMTELFKAHNFSKTYNQMNIRCCGLFETDGKVEMKFCRTTYFHSLVTNRAIDYKKDGISVRDLYACGPFLPSLEESELSNHIGFNGFVETSDGYVVFIFRHKHVSIAKNTLQSSVGASLKAKYALDENMMLTEEGIVEAIKNEIADELNLDKLPDYKKREKQIFADLTFKSVLCFYRELVEGGKPQFMFYTKIDVNKDELEKAYVGGIKKAKRMHDRYGFLHKVDGYKMLLVKREDLRKIYVTPDGMVVGKKFFKSVPSSAGTFALFVKYIETGEITCD